MFEVEKQSAPSAANPQPSPSIVPTPTATPLLSDEASPIPSSSTPSPPSSFGEASLPERMSNPNQHAEEAAPSSSPTPPVGSAALLIPVAGVRPDQLLDTYADARSEGRVHNAIDIIATRGTPVIAAANGRIVKLFYSERGGITIYQLSADERMIYYYAHLDRYADGLTENHAARQGEVIGYVGDTGNAGSGNYHLHFSISAIANPKRYWDGVNINPYPLLRGNAAQTAAP